MLSVIDGEVAAAYGWNDMEVTYDFRPFDGGSANDKWRWALSAEATSRLLDRLVALNRERIEANGNIPTAARGTKRGRRAKNTVESKFGGLFDGER